MKRSPSITSKLPALATLAVIVAIWLGASEGGLVPEFMLPSPAQVWDALVTDFPTLMANAAVTLQEAAYGLAIGIAVALALATLMHRVRMLYRALYPLLVVTQTIPTIAIAPLLVLWMGFGMAPKVTLVALTTFFPLAVSLLEGYASTDKAAADLLRSMGGQPVADLPSPGVSRRPGLLFLRAAGVRILRGSGGGDLRVAGRLRGAGGLYDPGAEGLCL